MASGIISRMVDGAPAVLRGDAHIPLVSLSADCLIKIYNPKDHLDSPDTPTFAPQQGPHSLHPESGWAYLGRFVFTQIKFIGTAFLAVVETAFRIATLPVWLLFGAVAGYLAAKEENKPVLKTMGEATLLFAVISTLICCGVIIEALCAAFDNFYFDGDDNEHSSITYHLGRQPGSSYLIG